MTPPGGWILAGVRTPFAKAGSVFKRVPSYELGRVAAAEVIARSELDPGRIDEVVFGHCAMPSEAACTLPRGILPLPPRSTARPWHSSGASCPRAT